MPLSPYELAMAFHEAATRRCASWEQDATRQSELDALGAEMDRRDVRLEDWDTSSRHS